MIMITIIIVIQVIISVFALNSLMAKETAEICYFCMKFFPCFVLKNRDNITFCEELRSTI